MLPYVSFLGIDLYTLMIGIGIVVAVILFRVLCDRKKLPAKVFNFFLIVIVCSVAVGFLFAALFQSYYNYLSSGVWKWEGMTFLGGFIGGTVCFLLFYFLIGHFLFRKREHLEWFVDFACCAVPCVVAAHAFGRIGCLFAGCCYGVRSEKFGLSMLIDGVWEKRVPTQLMESVFLFLLFGVLAFLLLKKNNRYILQIYFIAYGVWRFCIEYLRNDPRGDSGISFLTPSQLTSAILVLLGIALIFLYKFLYPKAVAKWKHYDEET